MKAKNVLSLAVAAALSLSMSVVVSAEDQNVTDVPAEGNTDVSIDVSVDVVTGETPIVYSVDIEWEDISFTFQAADKIWNPEELKYEENPDGGVWEEESKTVNVTNKSNGGITVDGDWEDAEAAEVTGVSVTVEGTELDSADPYGADSSEWDEGETVGEATEGEVVLTVDGTPNEKTATGTAKVIGQVVLTITPKS